MKRQRIDKPLVILSGEIKTPPFSEFARRTAGFLLRQLQKGQRLVMPDSRPMPGVGSRCHELRIEDSTNRVSWRIMYRIDDEAILVVAIFLKKSEKTPLHVIIECKRRLARYDRIRRTC